MTAASPVPKKLGIVHERLVKFTPPPIRPTMGMMMSFTSEFTMAVKAPPTATPTARSTTEPRLMNSINSLRKPPLFSLTSFNLALAWSFVAM